MKQHILLIENSGYWRKLATEVLENKGFEVYPEGVYQIHEWAEDYFREKRDKPDLVILACIRLRPEEWRLIEYLLEQKVRLLVLGANLDQREMLSLFRKGVTDVTDRPYNPRAILEVVNQALNAVTAQPV